MPECFCVVQSDMVTMIGAGATIDVAQGDPRKRRIAFGGDGAGAADDKVRG